MVTYFTTPVRALLLVAVLALSAQHVEAARPTTQPTATARADRKRSADADDALDGWLILAGVVGVIVFVAWLASRFGDNRSHVIN